MALPREYSAESCPTARSLEIVGERWTLPIVAEGVLTTSARPGGREEYVLTDKGRRLCPTLWSLITWGNENYLESPTRRTYRHAGCGGTIGPDRECSRCGEQPDARDLVVHPARHPRDRLPREDSVSRALQRPHRLLEPIQNARD